MFLDVRQQGAMPRSTSTPMSGPPYPPVYAALGGVPTVGLDVPITAVYLVLFMAAAAGHMFVFQHNKRAGHTFRLSQMMFGFCMARTVTCIMRIVWACYPTDVRIAIAASIFVVAGVVLLFAINLVFAQRLIRAKHPRFGWLPAFSIALKVLYGSIIVIIAMVITVVVQSYYTLNTNTRRIDFDVQRAGGVYLLFLSFLPIPMTLLAVLIPNKDGLDHFGAGRWRTKVRVLLIGSVLLCLGAAFRSGTQLKNPRPISDPGWYHSKACFYVFDLGVEIITIWLYLLARVDKRFHIPDNSKPLKSYEATRDAEAAAKGLDAEAQAEVDEVRPPTTSTAAAKDDELSDGVSLDDRDKA